MIGVVGLLVVLSGGGTARTSLQVGEGWPQDAQGKPLDMEGSRVRGDVREGWRGKIVS